MGAVFQEQGKPSVTLKAGDSLFVPARTKHAHWNPSYTRKTANPVSGTRSFDLQIAHTGV